MTGDAPSRIDTEWLSLTDLAQALGEPPGKIRRLLDDRHLVGTRRDGAFRVPSVFVVDGRPLASLRGTIIVLQDAGFSDDEVIDWLLTADDSIGMPPLEALRAGRKSEVRRVAAAQA